MIISHGRLPRLALISGLILGALVMGGARAQTFTRDQLMRLPLPVPEAAESLKRLLDGFDKNPGQVVADVALRTVTWGDIATAIRAQPRVATAIPAMQLYQGAVLELLERASLARLGEKEGLDKDALIQRRMKQASDEVLANELLNRSLAPNLTDQALRPIYDKAVAGKMAPDEVRVRIIMTQSEDAASNLIARLHAQADFEKIARENSKDGSATNGGDLGYMRRDQLTPEIGAIAFALLPGQTTGFPVRSGDYWFIVKVEGRRHQEAPTFEQARGDLTRDVIHAGLPTLRQAALKDAPVKFHLEPPAAAK